MMMFLKLKSYMENNYVMGTLFLQSLVKDSVSALKILPSPLEITPKIEINGVFMTMETVVIHMVAIHQVYQASYQFLATLTIVKILNYNFSAR